MPPRTRAPGLLVTVLLGVLLAAGCGGGATAHAPRRFTLVLDDFLIRPQRVQVPAGRLTLTVVNRGRIGHNLRIELGHHTVFSVLTLKPGAHATRSLRLRPGSYRMLCSVPQHEILGQYGTLVANR
ncbi:MAG TPA: cupredoxin domain-containing protein [Candidatus Dormibacteraeota bacterium]|nr:cupredoxin domain-containing protein [Candidatus Dormibacteraeota bacterium]